jgi:type I restriction enzyme M protein
MPRQRNSEVDAYAFIKEHLALQGWIVKNPNRIPTGQVWTQTECLDVAEIKRFLGQTHPENIVKVFESELYVIEAKREKDRIDVALHEAEEDYAGKINKSRVLKARIISGVAGNATDGFVVKSRFLKNGRFQPIKINGREITSFVSPQIAKAIMEADSPEIDDLPIDEKMFLKSAEEINRTLHLGAINKNVRAKVMAALLLSMVDDTRPNVDAPPPSAN